MSFKVGDTIKCIDANDYPYLQNGRDYLVTEVDLRGHVTVAGAISSHYSTRFILISAAPGEPVSHAPDNVPFCQLDRDQTEARLHALWLAVPTNCCAKCAAPLPCAYHE